SRVEYGSNRFAGKPPVGPADDAGRRHALSQAPARPACRHAQPRHRTHLHGAIAWPARPADYPARRQPVLPRFASGRQPMKRTPIGRGLQVTLLATAVLTVLALLKPEAIEPLAPAEDD